MLGDLLDTSRSIDTRDERDERIVAAAKAAKAAMLDSPQRPTMAPPRTLYIPLLLQPLKRWVYWCWVWKVDKNGRARWTKVLYRALHWPDGKYRYCPGDSTDCNAWDELESVALDVLWMHEGPPCQAPFPYGLGFVVTDEDRIVCIDIDCCRDPETGETASWALRLIRLLDSYTEMSPSKCGYKVFVRGVKAWRRCTSRVNKCVEVFARERFLVVTGEHVPGTPTEVMDRQEALDRVGEEFFPAPPVRVANAADGQGVTECRAGGPLPTVDRDRVMERARRYVARMQPAVSGDGGSSQTASVACVLLNGFALDYHDALTILQEYNQRCLPPWSDHELHRKLEWAEEEADGERGYLLNSNRQSRRDTTELIDVTPWDRRPTAAPAVPAATDDSPPSAATLAALNAETRADSDARYARRVEACSMGPPAPPWLPLPAADAADPNAEAGRRLVEQEDERQQLLDEEAQAAERQRQRDTEAVLDQESARLYNRADAFQGNRVPGCGSRPVYLSRLDEPHAGVHGHVACRCWGCPHCAANKRRTKLRHATTCIGRQVAQPSDTRPGGERSLPWRTTGLYVRRATPDRWDSIRAQIQWRRDRDGANYGFFRVQNEAGTEIIVVTEAPLSARSGAVRCEPVEVLRQLGAERWVELAAPTKRGATFGGRWRPPPRQREYRRVRATLAPDEVRRVLELAGADVREPRRRRSGGGVAIAYLWRLPPTMSEDQVGAVYVSLNQGALQPGETLNENFDGLPVVSGAPPPRGQSVRPEFGIP